jgi:acyl carrier protein
MELSNFIKELEEQFEKIQPGTITPASDFKNIDGWDSLTAMLVIEMINEQFGKTISANDLRECQTVEELFNRVENMA